MDWTEPSEGKSSPARKGSAAGICTGAPTYTSQTRDVKRKTIIMVLVWYWIVSPRCIWQRQVSGSSRPADAPAVWQWVDWTSPGLSADFHGPWGSSHSEKRSEGTAGHCCSQGRQGFRFVFILGRTQQCTESSPLKHSRVTASRRAYRSRPVLRGGLQKGGVHS